MREIKFRALIRIKDQLSWNWEYYSTFDQPSWYDTPFAEIKIKDLQYTGLKDKNGEEIYEGDIVKNSTHTVSVKWDEIEACWTLFGSYNQFNIGKWSDYEVIGNVWENPELLTHA